MGRDRRGLWFLDEPTARSPTAGCTTSPPTGGPRSMCRRWCSAIWGRIAATGVAFTRDPSTGVNAFYGEFLVNAQGEDVVAGIRTPQHLTIAGKEANNSALPAMEEVMPEVLTELHKVRRILENHYRDMQDIEFTVQRGKLVDAADAHR